ncbi:hypothetical protein GCM10020001_036660 [Nonomuraea salmonea]
MAAPAPSPETSLRGTCRERRARRLADRLSLARGTCRPLLRGESQESRPRVPRAETAPNRLSKEEVL